MPAALTARPAQLHLLFSEPLQRCSAGAGNEPQCASSCWDAADPTCALTGYFPKVNSKSDTARLMFAEICDEYDPAIAKGYDPYETLTLQSGAPVFF